MSTIQFTMLIALAAQLPLLAVAILVAFSARKKRLSPAADAPAARPRAKPAATPSVETAAGPPVGAVDEVAAATATAAVEEPPPAPVEPLPETPPITAAPITETVAAPVASAEVAPAGKPVEVQPLEAKPTGVVAEATTEAAAEALPSPPTEVIPLASVEAPIPKDEPEPARVEAESESSSLAAQTAPQSAEIAPLVPTVAPDAPAATVPVTAAEPDPVTPIEPRRAPMRIGLGLRKTRENFLARIRAAITSSAKLDEIYESLEEALIGGDVGVEASLKLVEAVRGRLQNDARPEVIRDALKAEIEQMLLAVERPFADSGAAPTVIVLAGVNGVGKTTTVAKLAARLKENGTVLVAAADTFRAAAIDQLQIWCDRVGVELIKQKQGSDPAAVAFDAVKAAVARHASAVLIDTAGRLQTKVNLMEELKKIARVIGRELPGAPHETWLVLDATTGQNALSQAKLFGDAVPLSGVILAKLDSTAKGGVIVAIAERLRLPVRFVGLGENLEDLRPFDPREFVEALFAEGDNERQAASGTYAA